MSFPRTSGILLHPTSLPGRYGVGDLGAQAYRFIDFLEDSQQTLWQILPLGPTGHGNSPYMAYSAMAGNPLLINLETLQSHGLLSEEDLAVSQEFSDNAVDYDSAYAFKIALLRKAAERFKEAADADERKAFDAFRKSCRNWLEDYGLFMSLKDANDGVPWSQWDENLAKRDAFTLNQARVDLAADIFFYEYVQFEFYRQWSAVKAYANERGIQIMGDMPIYVAHDSADVWANPENFMLDEETLEPALMAGVPPDYFSETGQLWGNPIYNWETLETTGFDWWIQRIQTLLDQVDIIRIDHFRAFSAYWAVPEGQETAINGEWMPAPGHAFFEAMGEKFGKLPFVAEDLGLIDDAVIELRDRFDLPGMKILQFAFGGDHGNPYLPFNIDRNFVVYTGTHDNNTTVGWFNEASDYERQRLAAYVGAFSPENVHWLTIRLALGSTANQAIIQLQDLMGLGSEGRMNTPGVGEGNWTWRYLEAMLTPTICEQLRQMTELYGRARDKGGV
jgi:4-alpha-glucanotransferase